MSRVGAAVILLLACRLHAHEGWGVVVSDIPGNTIWRIADGRAEPLLRNIHSHALIAGSDGAIYGTNPVPDGSLSSVWRVDANGRFSYVIPPARDVPLGLQSFLITNDGTIYSANRYDHRKPLVVLLRRDPKGTIVNVARFHAIDGMREMPDGSLVIADGATLRVGSTKRFTLTRAKWGEDLLGLSSVRDGTVHVADHAGRRILRVDLTTGRAHAVDRSSFFWAPAGVEVADNSLYILEHLRPPLSLLGDLQLGPYLRVRRSSTTLAVIWGRHTAKAVAVAAVLVGVVVLLRERRRPAG